MHFLFDENRIINSYSIKSLRNAKFAQVAMLNKMNVKPTIDMKIYTEKKLFTNERVNCLNCILMGGGKW